MDRYWFLTWRTYGTWLPGDARGFVDPVIDENGKRVIHNVPRTPIDADNPHLEDYARQIMKGEPVSLHLEQAKVLLQQFQETALHRQWKLFAIAILVNHVHLIVGVEGDPDPASLLRDFKSYGSRSLNRKWTKPDNGSWWSESGSKRRLTSEASIKEAILYVLTQEFPLLIWKSSDLE